MTHILGFIKNHWKFMFANMCLVLFLVFLLWGFPTEDEEEKEQTQPQVMTSEDVTNTNVLRNDLGISKQNAEIVQKRVDAIQKTQKRPDASYKVSYSSGDSLTKVVSEKIAQGDSTAAPEALKKTDRTVVVQPKEEEATVNVYKINTYRNWEVGTGFGVNDGNSYIPISLQRNYDKTHSLALEGQFDIDKQKFNGAEVQWKIRF